MEFQRKRIWALSIAIGLFVSSFGAPNASATVNGTFDITNAAGGGLIVSSTAFDFALPVGGGNGDMVTGIGTNVSFSGGGPLLAGTPGQILDFSAGGPVPNFMTFPTFPLLHFDLNFVGPGVNNTIAANTFDPNTPPSSPFAGSPLILQAGVTGTAITFSGGGTANDASGQPSNWFGLFTMQVSGVTPFQVQQTLLAGGTESSTYSGAFTVVPEPATSFLLLGGLLCGLAARRKLRSQNR
jgi:hypothetical protein